MIQKVTLPKLGETVEVSTIEKWLKQEGDAVTVGEVLCEITTDKATLEVESYYRGTVLKILAPAGKELPVGTLIAVIGDPGEKVPDDLLGAAAAAPARAATAKAAQAAATATEAAGATAAAAPAGRIVASPRARKFAKELLVNLGNVRGTGPGGRIVEADVRAAARPSAAVRATPVARKVAAQAGVDLAAVSGAGHRGKVTKDDVLRAAASPAPVAPAIPSLPPAVAVTPGEIVPLTAMRRIVAERMLESKRTIPCYYLNIDADVSDLVCLRNKINARDPEHKITFNDFVLKACGLALAVFPVVNSRWATAGIERRGVANVGFAVALDDGLIVPVVRDVDKKSLREISLESALLVERARSRKLQTQEYQGGCMTVSNLGMYGIKSFVPVVNPGESSILGLGLVEDRVVYRQGGIQVRKMMTLTLSADHRMVDGAVGAQFLEAIRDLLEVPQRLAECPGAAGK
jgi:pyruvate dehydrogenase E2 component (dihydrolipoamide acetyltransferase)